MRPPSEQERPSRCAAKSVGQAETRLSALDGHMQRNVERPRAAYTHADNPHPIRDKYTVVGAHDVPLANSSDFLSPRLVNAKDLAR